jgi:polyhydroxyalkanoate synthase
MRTGLDDVRREFYTFRHGGSVAACSVAGNVSHDKGAIEAGTWNAALARSLICSDPYWVRSMSANSIFAMLSMSDGVRRTLGKMIESAGYAPHETAWRPVQHANCFLRRYGPDANAARPVLIVPAPIKQPYIFDLSPQLSVVRRLLQAGFSVYMHEWQEERGANWNLDMSIRSLRLAIEEIAIDHGRAPMLVGHSLGGTLAAIAAALEPHGVDKLVLVQAPLRFGDQTGALRLISLYAPLEFLSETAGRIPGSVLNWASVAAAPDELVFERYQDAWASLPDLEALALHSRVIRWSLDEFAPPAQLLRDVIDVLYRQDRFARNELRVLGRPARADSLAEIPVAAIVDHTSRLVPSSSTLQPLCSPTVFAYQSEIGVALQHVGALVGRRAHREIWPRIVDWLREP